VATMHAHAGQEMKEVNASVGQKPFSTDDDEAINAAVASSGSSASSSRKSRRSHKNGTQPPTPSSPLSISSFLRSTEAKCINLIYFLPPSKLHTNDAINLNSFLTLWLFISNFIRFNCVNKFCVKAEKLEKPTWVPDDQATKCHKCESPFSLFLRKHHCRGCGQVFCIKYAPSPPTTTVRRGRELGPGRPGLALARCQLGSDPILERAARACVMCIDSLL
jgi:hypothetical protein